MIVECSITNFGPIRDTQTLSMVAQKDKTLEDYYVVTAGGLRLLKMALLYGPNASGKTNILKALECLRNLALYPKRQKSEILEIYPFQFDVVSRQAPTVLRIAFVQNNIRYDYTVELTNRYILREQMVHYPRGRPAELFFRETDPRLQLSTLRTGSKANLAAKDLAILEGNTLWNNTVLGAFAKSNVNWPELLQVQKWFSDTLQQMIAPETDLMDFANGVLESDPIYKALMVSLMGKADVQIEDILVEKSEEDLADQEIVITFPKDSGALLKENIIKLPVKNAKLTERLLTFVHKTKSVDGTDYKYERLPWNVESHGTQRYYSLTAILTLLIKTSRITTIDELESGLHPDLMKHFLLTFLFNSHKSQLIFSTHNLQLLDEQDILRRDAIWFTQKRVDGSTELYALSDFDSMVFRKGASVANAYQTGKLGATPNTGSIFIEEPI